MKLPSPPLYIVETNQPAIAECKEPPFPVNAMVFEEDTSLVLSANPAVRDPGEHPIRLMTALHEYVDQLPGQVLVRNGRPTRLLAIVHDLELEPTVRKEWVSESLDRVLSICQERQIKALGMEMLGCRHGRLGEDLFWSLLNAAIDESKSDFPQRIWVKPE